MTLPTAPQDEVHAVTGDTDGQTLTKSASGRGVYDQYLGPSEWRAASSWSFGWFSKTLMDKDSQNKRGLVETLPASSFQPDSTRIPEWGANGETEAQKGGVGTHSPLGN